MHGTQLFHSIRILYNLALNKWARNMPFFCGSCSIAKRDECQFSKWVDASKWVMLWIDTYVVNEITHLEESQKEISTNYDHILYLVEEGIHYFI